LGEGKLQGAQDNDFHYYLGLAYELLGEDDKARKHWQLGIVGPTDPAAAMYYNDAKPDKIFYAALCYRQLGNEERAKGLFYKLINYGKQHIFDVVTMDYFAVSLPDLLVWDADLNQKNRIHCLYMLALGYAGMGEREQAMRYLDEAVQLDINHDGINSTYSFLTKL
jgi:tetratricopeptide (TPR) repeat protein